MSRDYKPAKGKERSSKGSPFFAGVLVGLLLGVGISVGVAILVKGGDSPFVNKKRPAPDNVVNEETNTSALPKKAPTDNPAAAEKPRFDFYTILPGSESPVSEKEIKQQKAPEANKSNDNYFLQVGAFQTENEADNMKAKLALLGMEAVIQTATIPDKGVWHRVRVGPFVDLNQIDKARGDLTRNGFHADLIKIRSNTPDQ